MKFSLKILMFISRVNFTATAPDPLHNNFTGAATTLELTSSERTAAQQILQRR